MKPRLAALLGVIAHLVPGIYAASHLSYNGRVLTPQMGWDTYNAYSLGYDESIVVSNAQRIADLGFRDLGYTVIILDDAMTTLQRDSQGVLVANATKFPTGLRALSDRLHGLGLQLGMYSSAGKFTCGGYPGSLGHETEDAKFWAGLDADYVKYDNCYNEGQSGTPKLSYDRYAAMSSALAGTGRNMTYSLCNWGDDKPWEWASTIANSARMSGDIFDSFNMPTTSCPCGPDDYYCELPGYGCSVLNILGKASHIVSKAQPGYWNDLDMLEVGNGGMTYDEYKTHFSMWAAMKSPLIMGNDLTKLSPQDYAILINPAVLAISQDAAGSSIAKKWVRQVQDKDEWGWGEVQCWSGGLANGDQVVAFINAANDARTVSSTLVDLFGGLKTNTMAMSSWDIYDVWGNQTVMNSSVGTQVLDGKMHVSAANGYWNATKMSFAEGIAKNESLLFGTHIGTVQAGGTVSAQVNRHGVAMFRLRMKSSGAKRDEL